MTWNHRCRGRQGAVVATLVALAAPPASADLLVGASGDDHLWVVVPAADPGGRTLLRHHDRRLEGPWYTGGLPLPRPPEALAAWDDRVWLVFPPTEPEFSRRLTFTVQVHRDPAFGGYAYDPPDRLRLAAALEGDGPLGGFVGTAAGPVALLVGPPPPAGAGATRRLGASRLMRLSGPQWVEVPLPEGLSAGAGLVIGAAGDRGQILLVVAPGERAGGGGDPGIMWVRGPGEDWSRHEVAIPAGDLHLTRVGEAAVCAGSSGPEGDAVLAYLRPAGAVFLARRARPGGPWAALGLRDGVRLVERLPGGLLAITRIDPLGHAGPRRTMEPQRLPIRPVVQILVLVGCAVTAALGVFLLRTGARTPTVVLPEGMRVVSLPGRLLALGLDAALGAAGALILLDAPPEALLVVPWASPGFSDTAPPALALGLTVAHCTLAELMWARSLGKAIVGAVVVRADGRRPSAPAILVRNLGKAVVLVVPVLAVLALLNPYWMGPGDLLARTVVVNVRSVGPGGR